MSTQTPRQFVDQVKKRHPYQSEFHQAVEEVAEAVMPVVNSNIRYQQAKVLERLAEPDRVISFCVTWVDDNGEVHTNRGWRVQQSNLIGPYKGGLRFHKTVNESVLKFLAFEQCFKNALTGLPMGGAKGGADFDPKGRSEQEIMRFCQAFMMELQRYIGPYTDVPAGDINVGSREIGFLYGQYRKIHNDFGGVLTGKDIEFGGSHVRTEATGYGVIYFLLNMLANQNEQIEGKKIAVSGAGNVALHVALKATEHGAKVVTLSNSKGVLYKAEGLTKEQISLLLSESDKTLQDVAEEFNAQWQEKGKPWQYECDIAIPAATQNELAKDDAQCLIDTGCKWIVEGANMPCTSQAQHLIRQSRLHYAPGKASNAGGVALSGLEMSQNSRFQREEFAQLDKQLQNIMSHIHDQCLDFSPENDGVIDYAVGANLAGFNRLAKAMLAQGIV